MAKLTKRIVDAAEPAGRDYFLWDDELHGFGLRVFASGKRSYLVQYKAGGRTRRVTIGPHGVFTPDKARDAAADLLYAIRKGEDPAEQRATARTAITIAELADRYTTEWARRHKKPRSAEEDGRNLRLHVLPELGRHKVPDVTRRDVEKLHAALAVELIETGGEKGTPVRANRVLALLSKMFALAEEWGARPAGSNPCRGVRKCRERKRERYLSSEEVARLWAALDEADQSAQFPRPVVTLVRLLLLTGCRLGEVLTLRWDQVDFERRCLHLADSKSGAKVVLLNTPALDVLARADRIEGNPFVIAGNKPGSSFVGVQKAWQRLRSRAGLNEVRIHDLRHTYASVLAGLGMGLPVIGRVLGHSQASTTARYAHLADDPIRRAVERGGEVLAAMAASRPAQVIDLSNADHRAGHAGS